MNRRFVVTGLIIAVCFCFCAWYWAQTRASNDGSNKNETPARFAVPESLKQMVSNTEQDGVEYIGIETAQKKILLIWQSSRARGRQFEFAQEDEGTGNVDYRPRRELYEPGIHFDNYQPMPELVFMASLDLDRNRTKLSFPVLVDRETGVVLIHARGRWYDFEKWVVSKPGVHL